MTIRENFNRAMRRDNPPTHVVEPDVPFENLLVFNDALEDFG